LKVTFWTKTHNSEKNRCKFDRKIKKWTVCF